MSENKLSNRHLNAIAWGALFVWWGICFLPGVLPNGVDAAGTGVILLAACAVQAARKKRLDAFTFIAGTLCLVWGALDMTRSVLHLPWKLPVLAILLVVLGVELAAGSLLRRDPSQKMD
jgi:hypothetical protein